MKTLSILLISLGLMAGSSVMASENSSTSGTVNESSIVTGLTSTATVELTRDEIRDAITNGTDINETVATVCLFTNHENGDLDLTATGTANYFTANQFHMYSATYGSKDINIQVSSTTDSNWTNLPAGTAVNLTDHSDPQASGTTCSTNQVTVRANIPLSTLRVTQPGAYTINFTLAATDYSG